MKEGPDGEVSSSDWGQAVGVNKTQGTIPAVPLIPVFKAEAIRLEGGQPVLNSKFPPSQIYLFKKRRTGRNENGIVKSIL